MYPILVKHNNYPIFIFLSNELPRLENCHKQTRTPAALYKQNGHMIIPIVIDSLVLTTVGRRLTFIPQFG